MSAFGITVTGLKEAQAKLHQISTEMHGRPMVQAMEQATLLVTRSAKILSPVDTGRLRASITPEVRPQDNNIIGVVGSNVEYAPYQELGTSRMHAHPYLAPAFDENIEKIKDLLGDTVKGIISK